MTPTQQRHAALAPLIEQFDLAEGEPQDVPDRVALGGHELPLGVWEQSVLREVRTKPSDGAMRSLDLLAECMAFQARARIVIGTFETGPMPPPEELPDFLDRLVTDVAVGLALQRELEREVSRLIKTGELSSARNLAGLRKTIVACGSDMRHRVGTTTYEQAKRMAPALTSDPETPLRQVRTEIKPFARVDPVTTPAPAPTKKRSADEEPGRGDWQQACRDALYEPGVPTPVELPEVTPEPRSRIKPMLCVLGALIVIWSVVILPRMGSKVPPELTFDQFEQFVEVHEISARPPSLFIKLDAQAWSRLDEPKRRTLLGQIASIAGAEGYVGMHAVTTDGAAVGQWLKKSGVRLLGTAAGAS